MSEHTTIGKPRLFFGTGLFPWWLVLIQGIVALILGIMFLSWPFFTLMVAVMILGAYWFVSGLFALVGLAVDRSHSVVKIVLGILGIIAGILILTHLLFATILVPALLVIFIGVWGIIMGTISLCASFRGGGAGAAAIGIIGLIFGVVLLANPVITAAFMPIILGIIGIIGGIAAIIASILIRGHS